MDWENVARIYNGITLVKKTEIMQFVNKLLELEKTTLSQGPKRQVINILSDI